MRVNQKHQWASGRVSEHPVIVIDTSRTPVGNWATLALSADASINAVPPIRSATWDAAQEAHARMTELVRAMLASRAPVPGE